VARFVTPQLADRLVAHGHAVAAQKGVSVEELFRNEIEPQLLMHPHGLKVKNYFNSEKRQSLSFTFQCPEVAQVNATGGITGCDRSKCGAVEPANESPMCDWYNAKGCCTKENTESAYNGLVLSLSVAGEEEGDSCFDHEAMDLCGSLCSPDQTAVSSADPTGATLVACKDFCNAGIDACSDISIAGVETTDAAIDAAKAQCDSQPTSNCFNSAASLSASLATVFVAAASIVAFF